MEAIRGIQHPLQTPIILEIIFKNLKMSDLQGCRKVCRTWRHESGKAMRALAEVTIRCTDSDPRGPSRFLELLKNDKSTFFKAPFADTFALTSGVADCPEFWKTCGAHIKNLYLYDVIFSSADAFRHAIFQSCPNLKKLTLDRVEVCGKLAPESMEWVSSQFTQNRNLKCLSFMSFENQLNFGFLEILRNFPCLEKLVVRGMKDKSESIFQALEIARHNDASCWNLNEVVLLKDKLSSVHLPPSFVRIFGEGGLALTSLTITGIADDSDEDATTVQKLLVAQAHSLKRLFISQKFNALPETDIFPLPGNQVLEKVQVLWLIGVKMRSTRLLLAFPNLKKLLLDIDEIPEDTLTPHVTLDHCTELILHNWIHEIDDFKRLFDLLPNLKKLKIDSRLENEWFSLICENWQDLTHLELDVIYQNVDDSGISGYDEKDVRKINRMGRKKKAWRPITVRRANLSSLKNLKSFFWSVCSEKYSKVGYCTKACGILELPELKYLCMKRGEGNRVVPMIESLSEQFAWDDNQRITFD